MIRLTIIALSALGVCSAQTQPQVPENLKAPATEVVLLKTLGKGKQIYACKPKAGALRKRRLIQRLDFLPEISLHGRTKLFDSS